MPMGLAERDAFLHNDKFRDDELGGDWRKEVKPVADKMWEHIVNSPHLVGGLDDKKSQKEIAKKGLDLRQFCDAINVC